MKRNTPLRARSWCRSCGRSLCSCGEPPKLKRTPLPEVNRERKKRLRAEQFGTDGYREWIMGFPCCCCGAPPPSEPSHVRTRGAGGKADVMVPQCRTCHDRMSAPGWSVKRVEEHYDVDLRLIAAGLAERYRAERDARVRERVKE